MNREKAIRLKVYELLTAEQILVDEGEVSIYDEKVEDESSNIYIVLKRQTASIANDNCRNKWNCRIDLWIVNRQRDTISKDTTDDICERVEELLAPLSDGVEYNGWQMLNAVLEDLDYDTFQLTDTDTEIQLTLTYSLTAIKL